MKINLANYKSGLLIPGSVLVAAGVGLFSQWLTTLWPGMPDYISLPGGVSVVGGLLVIYDQYLWKLPVLSHLVTVPNIHGRYKGHLTSSYDGVDNTVECRIEINQTASQLHVTGYFKGITGDITSSNSIVQSIKTGEDGFYHLYFVYDNSGSNVSGKLPAHKGLNYLKVIRKEGTKKYKLSGNYFTDRDPQTKGEISVEFESKVLKGEF